MKAGKRLGAIGQRKGLDGVIPDLGTDRGCEEHGSTLRRNIREELEDKGTF